jgi:hypothetical protein
LPHQQPLQLFQVVGVCVGGVLGVAAQQVSDHALEAALGDSVSKAIVDFPDPDRPVKTTSLFLGIEKATFLRLWSRAPRMVISDISRWPPLNIHESSSFAPGRNCPAQFHYNFRLVNSQTGEKAGQLPFLSRSSLAQLVLYWRTAACSIRC